MTMAYVANERPASWQASFRVASSKRSTHCSGVAWFATWNGQEGSLTALCTLSPIDLMIIAGSSGRYPQFEQGVGESAGSLFALFPLGRFR